nr:MAG TPA: hypothetical protein [Caudoviricetes sp.]
MQPLRFCMRRLPSHSLSSEVHPLPPRGVKLGVTEDIKQINPYLALTFLNKISFYLLTNLTSYDILYID